MTSTQGCMACGTPGVQLLFSLGAMPPVNAFLEVSALSEEKAYPLDLFYCPSCTLVQLGATVPPEELFSHYLHLSSASRSNIQHLNDVAHTITERFHVNKNTRILEVGSNDGTLLAQFLGTAGAMLGIDPAKNLLQLSQKRGVETVATFFSPEVADEIVHSRGLFDVVLALNVVAHTPDFIGLLKAIRAVLAPRGMFMMEAAYVLETLLQGEFDTIYHEHVYCFSLHALAVAYKRVGLAIVDVEKIPTQGGSLRVFARRQEDSYTASASVCKLLQDEKDRGLTEPATYAAVTSKVAQFKDDLRTRLRQVQTQHGHVVGLGAPARGVVLLNYCHIGPDDLAYVIDDTPLKQGKLVPGVHIPVVSWDKLTADQPRAFLLLSWNYQHEIFEKLQRYVQEATVIVPFPQLQVIEIGAT